MEKENTAKAAQGMLERRGLRPTPGLLSATIMVLDKARGHANTDRSIRVEDVGSLAASHVVGRIGHGQCISIAQENPSLAARRLQVAELPDPPSVQDVAAGVVHATLDGIACELAVSIRQQQS